MIYFYCIGLIICFIVMVLWPLMDKWFADLEKGDETWIEDWDDN